MAGTKNIIIQLNKRLKINGQNYKIWSKCV